MSESRSPASRLWAFSAFFRTRDGLFVIGRGVCGGMFLSLLFVGRAWPWQAPLSWFLAMALAPLAVIGWQMAYRWLLRRMGAADAAISTVCNWSQAPLWLGGPGLVLFYAHDHVHHLLWHVALARILAVYASAGAPLALQVWALDTAPALHRWPPLRLWAFLRPAPGGRSASGALGEAPVAALWHGLWRGLRVHAAFLGLLAAGLAVRLRDLLLEGGDVAHFYFYASTILTDKHFLYYHITRDLPWPQDQLATFHLIMAPIWRGYYEFDWPQVLAIKIPTYTADVLSAVVVYVLALHALRRWADGAFGGGPETGGSPATGGGPMAAARRAAPLLALVAAALWYFNPWLLTATIPNAQSHAVALLFFVLAVARWDKPWLAGIFLALAATTRLEFGIAGIVAFWWFLRWRGMREAGLYALTSLGLLGFIAGPYALADFEAMRWALGGHLLERGEPLLIVQEAYRALGAATPGWLNALDNRYVGLANAAFAILVMFDPHHRRALAKAGLFYILTLPVIHARYLLFGWAALFLFALPHPHRLLALVPFVLWVSLDVPVLWFLGTFLAAFVVLFLTKNSQPAASGEHVTARQ